uniref:C-type lectin domain-containing protein n=1 Tax=Sphaeramia orbicularis TaxID=375764 RepID=A0A672YGE4_9TELE
YSNIFPKSCNFQRLHGCCAPGWTSFGNNCYMFNSVAKDWADAERTCVSRGANLASIHSPQEYAFIRDLVYTVTGVHKRTWIGGSDASKEGVWLWSDGSKFDFKGWAKGEPNNLGQEHCMEINLGDFVNDAKCKVKNSFLCAKPV